MILTFQNFDELTVFLFDVEHINSVVASSKLHIGESGLNKNGSLIQVKKHFILTGFFLLLNSTLSNMSLYYLCSRYTCSSDIWEGVWICLLKLVG